MDYRRCTITAQHWVELGIQCVGIGVLVSALVYRSWWGMLSICAGAPLLWRRDRRIWIWQKKEQLKQEFREVMEIVSGGLHAGYSLENAFLSARATADRDYPLMSRSLHCLPMDFPVEKGWKSSCLNSEGEVEFRRSWNSQV